MKKFDKMWLGTIVGILLPVLALFITYKSSIQEVPFDEYIRHSIAIRYIGTLLKISLIANLAGFMPAVMGNMLRFARGILLATFIYAGIIIYYQFA